MANLNNQTIDEVNRSILEQIESGMKADVQKKGESSPGKFSNPDSSRFDNIVIEEVEEIPEGDIEVFSGGYEVEEVDDDEWHPSDKELVIFVPEVIEPVKESIKDFDEEPMVTLVEEPLVEEELIPSELADEKDSAEIVEPPVVAEVEQFSPVKEDSQEEMPGQGSLSPILRQLEEMETIIPVDQPKKRSLAESSEGQKEVSQAESLDEDDETLTSRKKRKFSAAKGKNLPVRWSSRKVPAVKKEPKPEPRTPAVQKTRTRTPSAVMGRSREVMDELSVSAEFLNENKLTEVCELLKFQGWIELLQEDEPVDKDLVAEFFDKVSKVEMGPVVCLSFEFRGQQLMVTSRDLAAELGMKHEGFDLYTKKFWPENITESEKEEMEKAVCSYSDQNVNELSTNEMTATTKVLHRILVHSLLPRKSKTASAQILDILVLDQILRKKRVNWPKLILHHIEYISEFKEVGYAKVVKKILKLSGVYEPDLEVSVQRPLTTNSIHRWGFEFVDQVGWVKKDLKAPAEEKVPSKVSEGSDLVQIRESLARIEKRFDDQSKEISELKAMIREGFKGKRKA